jgi:hypothetical protein
MEAILALMVIAIIAAICGNGSAYDLAVSRVMNKKKASGLRGRPAEIVGAVAFLTAVFHGALPLLWCELRPQAGHRTAFAIYRLRLGERFIGQADAGGQVQGLQHPLQQLRHRILLAQYEPPGLPVTASKPYVP